MTIDANGPEDKGRKLTGWHVLAIFCTGFGIIIGVNVFMAYNAVSTFPGLEVSSSYADSQTFNDRRAAQDALGWNASVEITDGGQTLILNLVDDSGAPVAPGELTALLTRPTSRVADQELVLTRSRGAFTAPVEMAPGQWRLRMTGAARDGTEYRHNITFRWFPD
ncbi:MAG: FixH family protein [Pseudomonadota bacterium]